MAEKVEIRRPTALFVDKSGSMTEAIEVAKQLAALVGAVVSADFRVYAFDTAAFEMQAGVADGAGKRGRLAGVISALTGAPAPAGADGSDERRPALSDWERAFKLVKANGGTSIGAQLAKMRKDGVYV